MKTHRINSISIRILTLIGLILISIGTLSLFAPKPMPTGSIATKAARTTEDMWHIGTILLSVPRTTTRATAAATAIAAAKLMLKVSYSYTLTSNIPGLSFSPQKGQLASGQHSSVEVLIINDDSYEFLAYESPISSYSISTQVVSGVTIITTLPTKIVQNQSFALNVSITPTSQKSQETTTSSSNQVQEPVTTNLLGAPGIPVQEAFGRGYAFYIKPELLATAFTTDPKDQEKQLLSPIGNKFTYILTPNVSGLQTIAIPIMGIWTPINGGLPIEETIAMLTLPLNVLANLSSIHNASPTTLPFFGIGQVTLGELLIILLGSMLNIPWVWETLKKRQEKNHPVQPAQPIILVVNHDRRRWQHHQQKNISPPR